METEKITVRLENGQTMDVVVLRKTAAKIEVVLGEGVHSHARDTRRATHNSQQRHARAACDLDVPVENHSRGATVYMQPPALCVQHPRTLPCVRAFTRLS